MNEREDDRREPYVKCTHCYDSGRWFSVHGADRRIEWHECAACQPDLR